MNIVYTPKLLSSELNKFEIHVRNNFEHYIIIIILNLNWFVTATFYNTFSVITQNITVITLSFFFFIIIFTIVIYIQSNKK